MSLKINFKINKNKPNFILFVYESLNNKNLRSYFNLKEVELIKKSLNSNFNKKGLSIFNLSTNQKIVAVKINSTNETFRNEKLGADLYQFLKENFIKNINFLEENIMELILKNNLFFMCNIYITNF